MLKSEDMSRMTISGHKNDLNSLSDLLDKHQLVHLVDYNNEDEGFKIGTSLSYGSKTSEILVKLRSVLKLLEVSPNPPENLKLSSDIEKEIENLDSIASQAHDLKDKQRDCDRKIDDLAKLEKGDFDISEPKENCPIEESHDVILVPCIGLDSNGNRIGYGHGFYDKYLGKNDSVKIALTYSKQIVKTIPTSEYDVKMDWIVTESDIIKTS